MDAHTILLRLWQRRASVTAGLVALWLLIQAFAYHRGLWPRPVPWLGWADQGHSLDSAFAWRHWDLTPAKHKYPPGYALLGALFTDLMPWQPFAIPDALCLAAASLLFQRLAARLFPGAMAWLIAAPMIFVVATTRLKILRDIWFMPWSTTAAVPLQLLSLLLALRCRERPGPWRAAAWGISLGLLAGVRPVDAAVMAGATGVFLVLPPWRQATQMLREVAASGVGCAAVLVPIFLLHLAAHASSAGYYLQQSTSIGFEWRLLPLRWVLLVIDARPLTAESAGLAARIPWFAPGVAGLLYACLTPAPARAAWRLLTAAALLHLAVYLCYRDLEPGGLWRFYNVHYFKWIFPVLLLACAALAAALSRAGSRRRAMLCMAAVLPLFLLRAEFRPRLRAASTTTTDGVALRAGFPSIWNAVFLPITGAWWPLYCGNAKLSTEVRTYSNVADFKLFPKDGGALLLPLRPLPASGLHFVPGVQTGIAPAAAAIYGTVQIVPGIPCFFGPLGQCAE